MTNTALVNILDCAFILLDELRMRWLWNRIRLMLLGGSTFLLLFFAFMFSDNNMVGFSEFYFLSGTDEVPTLHIELTWGDTTWFSVIIYNKEDISMTYKLWFVDAGITNDSFSQPACLSPNETSVFGMYITGDTSFFTLPAYSSGTKTLSVTFPNYYSGTYTGCVMFFPTMTPMYTDPGNESGATFDIHTLPRRGGFMSALVHPSTMPVHVKAFPSNRIYQDTNKSNIWIIKIYDSNKHLISTSPLFTLNSAGTGEALISAPAGTYYIVFKGQSHLASYLSGVMLGGAWGEFLDFTTGINLFSTQQLNESQDDGNRYQSAGDLKNVLGDYDFMVNGNDIAIITAAGLQEWWIPVLDPRNLNGDGSINASDISVIGVNFEKTDMFFDGLFTW